jgi:hypothetical protein
VKLKIWKRGGFQSPEVKGEKINKKIAKSV